MITKVSDIKILRDYEGLAYYGLCQSAGLVPEEVAEERITPSELSSFEDDEVLVIDNNSGLHIEDGVIQVIDPMIRKEWGIEEGLSGQDYIIPTTEGLINMAAAINRFLTFANNHPEKTFFLTNIGCGIASYTPLQVAPLIAKAIAMANVRMPRKFWEYFWITGGVFPEDFKLDRCWMEYEHSL